MTKKRAQGWIAGKDDAGEWTAGAARPRRWVRWNAEMKKDFLDHVAGTCNVQAAAAAIGVPAMAAHRLHRRDAEFAAAWALAIEAGYRHLETHLIGTALTISGATAPDPGAAAPTAAGQFDPGFRMLRHRAEANGKPARGGPTPRAATREETDVEILKKLAVLAARRTPA